MTEENWPCIFQKTSVSSGHYDRWYQFYLSLLFTAVLYYFKDWGEGGNILFYGNQFELGKKVSDALERGYQECLARS